MVEIEIEWKCLEIAGYDSWRNCDPETRCYRVDNRVGFQHRKHCLGYPPDLVASRDSSFLAIGPFIIIRLVSNELIHDNLMLVPCIWITFEQFFPFPFFF